MTNNALYSKYRPICFKDMFGEEHIVKLLTNAISQNQISHAYIFHGPRGVGKTTAAKLFSKTINCLNLIDNNDACNKCKNCLLINNNQTLDIVELDAASNNGVSEIRNLIETVNYLPTDLKTKIFILDEAHMLTTGAWNALLKTIEDCPEHVVFIFATTEFHKIPLTIISRCQCLSFKPFSESVLFDLISKISNLENIKIESDAIKKIARLAKGAARDAITLLDQVKTYSNDLIISESNINDIFGLLDENKKIDFINLLGTNELEKIIEIINKFESDGVNLNLLINDIFAMLIDIFLYLKYKNINLLKTMSLKTMELVKISDYNQALHLAQIWEELMNKSHFSSNVKYNLELAIFKLNQSETNHNKFEEIEDKNIVDQNKTSKKSILVEKDKEIEFNEKKLLSGFETKEISVNSFSQSNKIDQEVIDENEINDLNCFASEKEQQKFLKETFFSIAKDYDKKCLSKYDKIFKNLLKESDNFSNNIFHLLKFKKILLASNEGIVLLYDSNDEMVFVNNQIFDKKIHQFIYEKFNKPLMFIAVTKGIAKQYSTDFSEIKDQNLISNLNIDKISSLIKNEKKNHTKEFAENLFGDDLKYE
ncbi:DNA polymerase III subunit gamma/tau [Mycoplasmoides pirum]|uniref:DNA polymerase III subunit gamma/tau n=1 Tax=Mycoplasmoides pirum TaxID=2122 RepID=UPI00069832BF|nr:DNA polymerase III subunit gamma/tau [Mycoplasmoides pirum]